MLIWDNGLVEWNCLFSLADAIRFTLFAMRSYVNDEKMFGMEVVNLDKNSFRKLSEDRIDRMIEEKEEGEE